MRVDEEVRQAARRLSSALEPHGRRLRRELEARLTSGGFTKPEREVLHSLTDFTATDSWPAACRTVALMNMDRDRISRVFMEFGEAAAAAGAAADVVRVFCALERLLCDARSQVVGAERQTMTALANIELTVPDAATLRSQASEIVRAHFEASDAAVGMPESRAASLRKTQQLDPASPAAVRRLVNPAWAARSGAVWSAPSGDSLLQVLFDFPRQLCARETGFLECLGSRIAESAGRVRKSQELRTLYRKWVEGEELRKLEISRELHDEAAQSLAVIRLELELLGTGPVDSAQTADALSRMTAVTDRTISSIRELISDLAPAILQQLGLAAAVRQLANRLNGDSGIQVESKFDPIPALPAWFGLVLYRIMREGLANVARHSHANHVAISVSLSGENIRLSIQDDGVGFDPHEALLRPGCYGLSGVRSRVHLLGGDFSLRSHNSGSASEKSLTGTHLSAEIPLKIDRSIGRSL